MTLCTLPEYSLRSKEYVVTNVRCTELRHCVSSINVEILRRKSASYDLSMRKSPTVYFISQRFTYYDLGHNLILFCHKDSKNIDCGKIISSYFAANAIFTHLRQNKSTFLKVRI